jgi:hypothetical protein
MLEAGRLSKYVLLFLLLLLLFLLFFFVLLLLLFILVGNTLGSILQMNVRLCCCQDLLLLTPSVRH